MYVIKQHTGCAYVFLAHTATSEIHYWISLKQCSVAACVLTPIGNQIATGVHYISTMICLLSYMSYQTSTLSHRSTLPILFWGHVRSSLFLWVDLFGQVWIMWFELGRHQITSETSESVSVVGSVPSEQVHHSYLNLLGLESSWSHTNVFKVVQNEHVITGDLCLQPASLVIRRLTESTFPQRFAPLSRWQNVNVYVALGALWICCTSNLCWIV